MSCDRVECRKVGVLFERALGTPSFTRYLICMDISLKIIQKPSVCCRGEPRHSHLKHIWGFRLMDRKCPILNRLLSTIQPVVTPHGFGPEFPTTGPIDSGFKRVNPHHIYSYFSSLVGSTQAVLKVW